MVNTASLGLTTTALPIVFVSVMLTVFDPVERPRPAIGMLTVLVLESPAAQLMVWLTAV